MDIKEVYKKAEDLLSKRMNNYSKILVKCWVYHCESRMRNNNPPYTYTQYITALPSSVPMDYVQYDLIDYSDIGTKEEVLGIIQKWWGV